MLSISCKLERLRRNLFTTTDFELIPNKVMDKLPVVINIVQVIQRTERKCQHMLLMGVCVEGEAVQRREGGMPAGRERERKWGGGGGGGGGGGVGEGGTHTHTQFLADLLSLAQMRHSCSNSSSRQPW